MARRKKAVTGLVNELSAQLDFAKDPNILVFTPLGGLGPIDIVTLNMTTGEYTAYDVKTKNFRKQDYQAKDGYKASHNTLKELYGDRIEDERLAIKFECREVTIGT